MLSESDILQTLMKWRTRVSAAAWIVLRDAHAAEDIFQNVPLKAMTREVSFETESALISWAFAAEPLLWPVPERDSVMLYAVALAAWKSSEHPVVLHADSKLRFRGRTERAQTVRFGFSAQKIRGVFAGKFEVDIPTASLGPAGETWEVELPRANFRPLHPQLAAAPEGLELNDVYALTIQEDAGLEIHPVELVPRKASSEHAP
jgi:hypothetical protein